MPMVPPVIPKVSSAVFGATSLMLAIFSLLFLSANRKYRPKHKDFLIVLL